MGKRRTHVDPRVIRTYQRELPEIPVREYGELTIDEMRYIFEKYYNLNTNNELVQSALTKAPLRYPSLLGTLKQFVSHEILEPLRKKYGILRTSQAMFTIDYWLMHGYSEEEAKEKLTQLKNDRYREPGTFLDPRNEAFYKKIGITEYKDGLSLDDIKRIIFRLDKNWKPESDALNDLAKSIQAKWK